jgi:hypothetical protein
MWQPRKVTAKWAEPDPLSDPLAKQTDGNLPNWPGGEGWSHSAQCLNPNEGCALIRTRAQYLGLHLKKMMAQGELTS